MRFELVCFTALATSVFSIPTPQLRLGQALMQGAKQQLQPQNLIATGLFAGAGAYAASQQGKKDGQQLMHEQFNPKNEPSPQFTTL